MPHAAHSVGARGSISNKVGATASPATVSAVIKAPTGPMPSIAVIPSRSMDTDDYENPSQRKARALANALRNEVRRKSHDPSMHIYSNMYATIIYIYNTYLLIAHLSLSSLQ